MGSTRVLVVNTKEQPNAQYNKYYGQLPPTITKSSNAFIFSDLIEGGVYVVSIGIKSDNTPKPPTLGSGWSPASGTSYYTAGRTADGYSANYVIANLRVDPNNSVGVINFPGANLQSNAYFAQATLVAV